MANRKDYRLSLSLGHLFLLSNLALGILGFIYLQWSEGAKSSQDLGAQPRVVSLYTNQASRFN